MDLLRSSASAQGVDADGVRSFLRALETDPRIDPHGVIIQRHGARIVEAYWAPHTAERNRLVYSLSKTFTGTALGLQLQEGRLGLDDLVSDHLPDLFEGADPLTRRMRIRHIASMSTGHVAETMLDAMVRSPDDPVAGFLQLPPDREPGTVFAYNQPPVLALARILQQLCGTSLVDYLQPRLFEPLGIEGLRWVEHRPGMVLGFSGVYTNLDAVARLGQLYLDDGVWAGRRLLHEGWVGEASRAHIDNPLGDGADWRQGYGLQLWRSQHGYRGDGAFGQFMLVLPEHNAVVALFSCTDHMQVVLDYVWDLLLPAFCGDPLSGDGRDLALADVVAALQTPTVADRSGGTDVLLPRGRFEPAPAGPTTHRTLTGIEVRETRDGTTVLVLIETGGTVEVLLGSNWSSSDDGAVAACAAQLGDGRIAIDVVFVDTPHRLEIVVDPRERTFRASWPLVPLFGAGIGPSVLAMRAPD